jgi:predicted DNA-binding transcriptional regulator AlpA
MTPQSTEIDPLLTPDAAGAVLGIARQTLARWRVEGKGPPYVKLGSRVAYRRAALNAWVLERERHSTTDDGDRQA